MKKTLLLSFTAAMLYLAVSSFSTGPSATAFTHTTAENGCGGGSCHGSASSSATAASLIVIHKSTGDTVRNGQFTPGETYTVVVGGTNAVQSHYGFILRASQNGGTAQAGTFANPMPGATTKTQMVGGFTVFEHKAKVPAMSGGFSATVDWTAPAQGGGTVTMHLAVNGVDNNNGATGDQWNTTSTSLAEAPVSVSTVATEVHITAYPNPAASTLYLKGISNTAYNYTVYNLNGSVVAQGMFNNSVDVSSLASGTYFLNLTNGQTNEVVTFNKQ